MKATAFEFRFRMLFVMAITVLGFWAPWIQFLGIGSRRTLLEWLALVLSRLGLVSFTVAAPVVIVTGALIAGAGAALRVCGTAYLGSEIVKHQQMQAAGVMADGPYRYLRNPLYLGLWLACVATAFLMPATGSAVSIVLLGTFIYRLTLGEEAFLAPRLGDSYQAYLRAVPRLIPSLRTSIPSAGSKPRWGQALVYEMYPIGIFLILACLSWSYNNLLMQQALLVAFGLALIGRALLRKPASAGSPGE
jgi:protein-S-isoprenylcysteine O-methyltransferase Ste14